MTARNYSSVASAKTLNGNVTNSATQITLNSVTGLPTPPYTLVLNPDTAIEEIVTVDADQSGVTSPTLKVTRAQDGTTAQAHTSGNTVKHMITARDLQEPQDHINATAAHGATGAVVGTTNTQTLTNKTLTSPKINENVAVTATATELNVLDGITASTAELNILDGATLTTTELNYVDGVTSAIQTQLDALIPKGMISPFGGSSAPSGWLLCNGAAVSRTTYSALFAVIGTTYGSGDTSTTFNVPDLLGRTPIGAGAGTGLTTRTLGDKLGSESTVLTSSHIPEHNHTIDHGHSNDIGVSTGGSHSHTLTMHYSGTASHDHAISGISNPLPSMESDGSGGSISNSNATAISTASAHDHGITGGVTNHTGSSGYYGTASPTAVTAVQPSTVVNFIIKY